MPFLRHLLLFALSLILLSGCINNQPHLANLTPPETIQIPEIITPIEETSIPEPEITVSEEVEELQELGDWEKGDTIKEAKSAAVTMISR